MNTYTSDKKETSKFQSQSGQPGLNAQREHDRALGELEQYS